MTAPVFCCLAAMIAALTIFAASGGRDVARYAPAVERRASVWTYFDGRAAHAPTPDAYTLETAAMGYGRPAMP